jgi:membrane protease YdiL (CAAX protease family)
MDYVVIFILGSALGVETGFRGFALPRWQQRSGPLVGTLILGVLWGLWFFPIFLLPGSWGAGTGLVGISIPFVEFVIGFTALAVIFTWVFNNTRGSLLLVMLLLTSLLTAGNTFGTLFSFPPGHPPVLLSLILSKGVAILYIGWIVVALLIIIATRGRLSYQRYLRETALPAPVNSPGQSMALAHRLSQVMRRHPLFFFYLMAYAFSWLTWLPLVLSQDGLRLWPFHMPLWNTIGVGTLLGPMLSAFIVTGITEGKPGIDRLLSRFILWRVQLRWYLFVLLGMPALVLLSILVLPGTIAAFPAPAPTFVLVYLVNYIVTFIFGGALGEETGWSGFALPRWQQRSGPLVGTLILGVLWGLWHFPLFLIPGNMGAGTGFVGIGIPFVESVIAFTVGAAIFTWVFNNTRGSLLLVMLLFASIDTAGRMFGTFFPSLPGNSPVRQSWDIVVVVVALLIILATRGRLSYQRYLRETALPAPVTDQELGTAGTSV